MNNVKINNDPIQQYYLPEDQSKLSNRTIDIDFHRLLQQKINLASQLNKQINDIHNSALPSSLIPNFLSLMNNGVASFYNPMNFGMHNLLTTEYDAQTVHANGQTNATSYTSKQTKYNDIIREAANTYNVEEKLIHAMIKVESNYNPQAKSHAGAVGLMQLMPATARYLGVTDRYDVRQNIFGGTKYISEMLRQQSGNLRLALAAYNAGPGNVKKYGGVPPFKETQNYIQKIMSFYTA